jgi:hypothetical protein
MKNIILLVLGILVLSAVGVGGYFLGHTTAKQQLQPTPSPIIVTPFETSPPLPDAPPENPIIEGGATSPLEQGGAALPETSGSAEEAVFCTMDAKMCPDGSYVGRSGPTCEFAPCPGE